MLEIIETSFYLMECQIYNSLIDFRQRCRRRKSEPTFDSEALEAYRRLHLDF